MRTRLWPAWMCAVVMVSMTAPGAAEPGWGTGQGAESFSGDALFRTYCASCHGQSGRGNGAVAIFLRVAPADLTQIAARNKGTFPKERVYQIIDGRQAVKTHGESQMPIWGDAFAKTTSGGGEQQVAARIRALVEYLESIQSIQKRPGA